MDIQRYNVYPQVALPGAGNRACKKAPPGTTDPGAQSPAGGSPPGLPKLALDFF